MSTLVAVDDVLAALDATHDAVEDECIPSLDTVWHDALASFRKRLEEVPVNEQAGKIARSVWEQHDLVVAHCQRLAEHVERYDSTDLSWALNVTQLRHWEGVRAILHAVLCGRTVAPS